MSKIKAWPLIAYTTDGDKVMFVLSKKFGNAVQRNRARRRIQEAIREVGGVSGVKINASKEVLDMDYSDLLKSVRKLKAGLK